MPVGAPGLPDLKLAILTSVRPNHFRSDPKYPSTLISFSNRKTTGPNCPTS